MRPGARRYMSQTVKDGVGCACVHVNRVRETRGLLAVIGVQTMREPKGGLVRRRPITVTVSVWYDKKLKNVFFDMLVRPHNNILPGIQYQVGLFRE